MQLEYMYLVISIGYIETYQGTTLGQTLQSFKIRQYFYFCVIALFKHLKMSQKSIFQ